MKPTNKYKQNLVFRVLALICLSVVLGLAGCEQKGTAEKAGQKIDRAAEKAELRIGQATEKADQKIEAAKEAFDQQADKSGQTIDESTSASKEALEKAVTKIDIATENAEKGLESAKESVTDKAEKAGEYIDDSVITIKVKTALLNDSLLKTPQIEVTTVNGVVKLSGTVDSEQSIGRVMEVASSQPDVKSVQNDLIVKTIPGTK